MKKLFFILSMVTATVFTNQTVKPMSPPKNIHNISLKPHFQCGLRSSSRSDDVCQLVYQICTPTQILTPLPTSDFDVTFITLTFAPTDKPNKDGTSAVTSLIRTEIKGIGSRCTNATPKVCCFQPLIFPNCSFQASEFYDPSIIESLIKKNLSRYFRLNVLKFPNCMYCSEEIKDDEPAILLKCGSGIHEACYNVEGITQKDCSSCGKTLKDDNWYRLEPLPKTAE